jgi:hypothetical protein
LNAKSALATAAVAAAGVVLSAGAAHAAAPRISGHDQLRAGIAAAVAAMPAHELTAESGGPAGMPAEVAAAAPAV